MWRRVAKSITARYPANEITFFRMVFGLVPALMLAAHAGKGRQLQRTRHWRAHLGILLLLGVAAGTGQLLMTSAFRHGEVGVLAPFNYSSIVWATLFGYVVWGESVGAVSLLGIVLIVGSSVAVALRRKDPDALNV